MWRWNSGSGWLGPNGPRARRGKIIKLRPVQTSNANILWNTSRISAWALTDCISHHQVKLPCVFAPLVWLPLSSVMVINRESWNMERNFPFKTYCPRPDWDSPYSVNVFVLSISLLLKGEFLYLAWNDLSVFCPVVWNSLQWHGA